MKSKLIAVSAIAAGFTALCLVVGIYIEMADMFSLVISSAFVLLPIYYKSYKGCIMAYLAGGVIAAIIGGFNFLSLVLPSFFVFFGLYPIISLKLREIKLKKAIYVLIGLLWSIAYFYGAYFYYTGIMGISIDDFPSWLEWARDCVPYLISILGIIFYFIYDRFVVVIKILIDKYLSKIVK